MRSSENIIQYIMASARQPYALDFNVISTKTLNNGYMGSTSLLDIMRDGIMWNTPKQRKSIEVRNRQMFGVQEWGNGRMLKPNRRIRVDNKTGEFFELGKLAPKMYEKIMNETSEIKSKISDTFGAFSPRDKEASILYEGESAGKGEEKHLSVKMEKARPTFFSRNLTEKTQVPSNSTSSTTVRPSGLA